MPPKRLRGAAVPAVADKKAKYIKYVDCREKYAVGQCGERPFVSGLFDTKEDAVNAAAKAWGIKGRRSIQNTFYPQLKCCGKWKTVAKCLYSQGTLWRVKYGSRQARRTKTFASEAAARLFLTEQLTKPAADAAPEGAQRRRRPLKKKTAPVVNRKSAAPAPAPAMKSAVPVAETRAVDGKRAGVKKAALCKRGWPGPKRMGQEEVQAEHQRKVSGSILQPAPDGRRRLRWKQSEPVRAVPAPPVKLEPGSVPGEPGPKALADDPRQPMTPVRERPAGSPSSPPSWSLRSLDAALKANFAAAADEEAQGVGLSFVLSLLNYVYAAGAHVHRPNGSG